jgi:hypothetical protein
VSPPEDTAKAGPTPPLTVVAAYDQQPAAAGNTVAATDLVFPVEPEQAR